MQLFELNSDSKDAPVLLPGQDAARYNQAAAFSPDGTKLAMVSGSAALGRAKKK